MVEVGTPQNGDSNGPSCTTLAVGRCKCFMSMVLLQERLCFRRGVWSPEPGGGNWFLVGQKLFINLF